MSSSDRTGASVALVAAVAAWLLLGAVAGAPAMAASDAATLEDDDDLLNETSDTVEGIVSGTTTAVVETTDTVDGITSTATGTVDATVGTTGDTIDVATGGASGDATDAVTVATDGVTDVTNTTTDEATETVDATASTADATTADATSAASATTEGNVTGAAGSLGDATAGLTSFTVERVGSTTETTGTVVKRITDGTTESVTELTGGSVEGTTTTAGDDAETTADSSFTAGAVRDRARTSGRAARLAERDATATGVGGPTDLDGPVGIRDGGTTGGERSMGAGSDDPSTVVGDWDDLPVSESEAAGVGLGALLIGAAGVAVRQGSALGGTGTGTTALRAAAARAGEGPLSRLARMLSAFRYSRYDDSDPLELDARRDVYEAISDRPGDPITAVSDRAEVNLSTARHHVKVLRREGLVATARVRNCERFYPAGTDDLELAAAMADEATADILDALVRLEPASVSGLADEVDRSPSTVTHHLQKLEEDDIVVRERAGRAVENTLSEPARAALDPETERRPHAAEQRLDSDPGTDAASGAGAD